MKPLAIFPALMAVVLFTMVPGIGFADVKERVDTLERKVVENEKKIKTNTEEDTTTKERVIKLERRLKDSDFDKDRYTVSEGDCNDSDPAVNPGETEICDNGIDDNCDGVIDDLNTCVAQ